MRVALPSLFRRVVNRARRPLTNMDSLPAVDIDQGKFKYVQILVKEGDKQRYLVRGYKWASYHADVFTHCEENELRPLKKQGAKISWSCPGGGRIVHDTKDKNIQIYGYSQSYGRPDHSITCELIKVSDNPNVLGTLN